VFCAGFCVFAAITAKNAEKQDKPSENVINLLVGETMDEANKIIQKIRAMNSIIQGELEQYGLAATEMNPQ